MESISDTITNKSFLTTSIPKLKTTLSSTTPQEIVNTITPLLAKKVNQEELYQKITYLIDICPDLSEAPPFFKLIGKTTYEMTMAGNTRTNLIVLNRKLIPKSKGYQSLLKVLVKKMNGKKLANFLILLGEGNWSIFAKDVESKLKTQMKNFESKGIVLTREILACVDKDFLKESVVLPMLKLLKKSVNNIAKVANAFKLVERTKEDAFVISIDQLLIDSLADNITKGEAFQGNCSALIRLVLVKRREFSDKGKIETFLTRLIRQIAKTKTVDLQTFFCELVLDMELVFKDNINIALLNQFVQSLNVVKDDELKEKFFKRLIIRTLGNEDKTVESILLKFKLKEDSISYAYSLIKCLTTKKEDMNEEIKELSVKYEKLKNGNLTMGNLNEVLYSMAIQLTLNPDNDNCIRLCKKIVEHGSITTNKHLYSSISYFDALAITFIINKSSSFIADKFKEDSSEYKNFCFILGLLAKPLLKFNRVKLSLTPEMIQMIVIGLYMKTFAFEEIKKDEESEEEEDKDNQDILNMLIKQPNFSQINSQAIERLILIMSFSENKEISLQQKNLPNAFKTIQIGQEIDNANNINIFSSDKLLTPNAMVKQKYINFLSNLLFFCPSFIFTVSNFFNCSIILKLTRIKRVTNLVKEGEEFNPNLLLTKEDLDVVGRFGFPQLIPYNKLADFEESDFAENIKGVIEQEENEDEKFEELNNLNDKAAILEEYRLILANLEEAISMFFQKYGSLLREEHFERLKELNNCLQNTLSKSKHLVDNIKRIFIVVFREVYSNANARLADLGQYYYFVLCDTQTSAFFRKLEYFIDKLDFSSVGDISKEIYEILFEILVYTFNYKFDIMFRKKLFIFLSGIVFNFEGNLQKFFDFVCKNINELFFKEAFEILKKLTEILLPKNGGLVDQQLKLVLDYEEFSQKVVLDILLEKAANGKIENQVINSFQKLKLLILAKSENEEIAEKANSLLNSNVKFKFNQENFKNLDFRTLLLSFPFDLYKTISDIFETIFENLNGVDRVTFITNFLFYFEESLNDETIEYGDSEYEESLEVFISILSNLQNKIPEESITKVFDTLLLIETNEYNELTKSSINLGVRLIQNRKKITLTLTKQLQAYIKDDSNLLSPIIFIGECAKSDKDVFKKFKDMEHTIKNLLKYKNVDFHKNLSKFLRNLIGFFNKPKDDIKKLTYDAQRSKNPQDTQIYCYFIAGLTKGVSLRFISESGVFEDIENLLASAKKKDLKDLPQPHRLFCVYIIESLWSVFGKALEPFMTRLIPLVMQFLGDNDEKIRNVAKGILDLFMQNMSAFGLKQSIPTLLRRCDDKNWRTKLHSVLALGAVAFCGSKQLAANLPTIVPQLTRTINDTNAEVKEAAVKSLGLILSTVKNPEISELRDTIISSLSDPFNNNTKSLDRLLHTDFRHYIDGPALSLVVPIVIYGLKNSKEPGPKEKAAKVVANISRLVSSDDDVLPHMEGLLSALESAAKEGHDAVRAFVAKAFKSLAERFRFLGKTMLNRLKLVLEDKGATSIERAGAAQAFSEVLGTFGEEERAGIVADCLSLTQDNREFMREGFLSVFVYLPIVMGNEYEVFVFKTIQTIVESISHETEKIRNLAIKSIKILIQNYLKKNIDLLIIPFFEGAISENPTKRNSSLILLGDVIDILFEGKVDKEEVYKNYPRLFSIFYIMKNDSTGEVRLTANNIYKTFVDNTMKCLKTIYPDLIECFIDLYVRDNEYQTEIANNGIKEFSYKFGDIFIHKVVGNLKLAKNDSNMKKRIGAILVLNNFISNFNKGYIEKERLRLFLELTTEFFDSEEPEIYKRATEGLRILSERTNQTDILEPIFNEKVEETNSGPENSSANEKTLALICECLKSKSQKLATFVNGYVFTGEFREWQLDVIIKNSKLYGELLYNVREFRKGILPFFEFVEVV